MPAIRELPIDPPTIGRVYAKAREHKRYSPFGIGYDPSILATALLEPDTVVYELGDFGGVLIVTDVAPVDSEGAEERIARPHILIWDSSCYRMGDEIRSFAVSFMQERQIHRLIAEIDASNDLARGFIERVGFNLIGTFRSRIHGWNGQVADTVIYDALITDLVVS